VRTFEVNSLRVWLDDIGSHVAGDVENLLVVLDGIAQVNGSIVIFSSTIRAIRGWFK